MEENVQLGTEKITSGLRRGKEIQKSYKIQSLKRPGSNLEINFVESVPSRRKSNGIEHRTENRKKPPARFPSKVPRRSSVVTLEKFSNENTRTTPLKQRLPRRFGNDTSKSTGEDISIPRSEPNERVLAVSAPDPLRIPLRHGVLSPGPSGEETTAWGWNERLRGWKEGRKEARNAKRASDQPKDTSPGISFAEEASSSTATSERKKSSVRRNPGKDTPLSRWVYRNSATFLRLGFALILNSRVVKDTAHPRRSCPENRDYWPVINVQTLSFLGRQGSRAARGLIGLRAPIIYAINHQREDDPGLDSAGTRPSTSRISSSGVGEARTCSRDVDQRVGSHGIHRQMFGQRCAHA
ncbi:uncharacterized protein LOC143153991 [Ptiloglossa arizonensis]|uniref:uncharacterized protein LOC143153991 n=1 Tax=Ptiloglossa arizonensis TaxID=3350558 RepID=UPI003FA12FDE